VFPNEFPKEATDAHLLFRGKMLVGIYGVFKVGKSAVTDGLLPNLVAKVEEGSPRRRIVALDDDENKVLHCLVVVKGVNWICVEIHDCSVWFDGANIGIFRKRSSRRPKKANFFHTYINICPTFLYFCTRNFDTNNFEMVTELIIVWVLGVVAFFVLWAILLKVIKRISERKQKDEIHVENADSIEPKPEQHI